MLELMPLAQFFFFPSQPTLCMLLGSQQQRNFDEKALLKRYCEEALQI
jgi:hypothetical protein